MTEMLKSPTSETQKPESPSSDGKSKTDTLRDAGEDQEPASPSSDGKPKTDTLRDAE